MYWVQRRLNSQNFLVNRDLVSRIIRGSSITSTDTVLEIGPGAGIITGELHKITSKVITVEKDPRYTSHPQDFLTYSLPKYPFKVFANIPFGITGEIVRKLLACPFLTDCYLVMQAEAAAKFLLHQHQNTMAAILYYPFWQFSITHRFLPTDFFPRPKVACVLVHIYPRQIPLITSPKNHYQDFVAYFFTHNPLAKYVPPTRWLKLFTRAPLFPGAMAKLQREQAILPKIRRFHCGH